MKQKLKKLTNKMHNHKSLMTTQAITLGLITMISFAIIDATIFLISEEEFYDYLKDNVEILDEYTTPILISGVSSAISILIAKMFTHYILKEKYNYIINEHPIIDFAGVLIGMTGVVSIYHLIEMKNKRDI